MAVKYKLVVSDLHLGYGRQHPDGRVNALEEFYYDEKFVEFLHFHQHGQYENAEIELILNGDILNFLQVDYRGHRVTVITESVSMEKLRGIIKGHPRFFSSLREFAAHPLHSITYVVGNHDQGMLWPGCRQMLNEAIGASVRYKNLVYNFDGVHLEHGHMHEAANRFDPRKFFLRKNLPEPILNLPFGSHFFIDFVMKIKEQYPHVDKIRPFSRMIRWSLMNQTWLTLKGIYGLVWYFVKSMLYQDPRRAFPFRRILKVIMESAVFPDLSEAARRILTDPRVHTVIFGHTHVYKYRQFESGKEYLNTGTWTELTSLDITSFGRITKLTYVIIDYNQNPERPVARLKQWHGYHRIEEDLAVS